MSTPPSHLCIRVPCSLWHALCGRDMCANLVQVADLREELALLKGGEEVLLAYYGGAQNAGVVGMTEDQVVAKVHADAQEVLLKQGSPLPKVSR